MTSANPYWKMARPRIQIGPHTTLLEIHVGAESLGVSTRAFTGILAALHVPCIAIGHSRYYNEAVFDLALFTATYFHMQSLATPGSTAKCRGLEPSDPSDPDALPPIVANLPADFPTPDQLSEAMKAYTTVSKHRISAARAAVESLSRRFAVSESQSSGFGPITGLAPAQEPADSTGEATAEPAALTPEVARD